MIDEPKIHQNHELREKLRQDVENYIKNGGLVYHAAYGESAHSYVYENGQNKESLKRVNHGCQEKTTGKRMKHQAFVINSKGQQIQNQF